VKLVLPLEAPEISAGDTVMATDACTADLTVRM
jgi:hypothetical protein